MYAFSFGPATSIAATSKISPTPAPSEDLIQKTTTWRWGPQEQQAFEELKDKWPKLSAWACLEHKGKLSW